MARAVAEGRRPENMIEEEEISTTSAWSCSATAVSAMRPTSGPWSRFGEQGVVEIVSLMGYYTMISMLSNTIAAPAAARRHARAQPVPERLR